MSVGAHRNRHRVQMADKEGWLVKKAVKSLWKQNWKKRWFVLHGNTLIYRNAQAGAGGQALLLSKHSVVNRTTEHEPREHELVILDPKFTLYACGETEADANDWVDAIRAVIKTLLPPDPAAAEPITEPPLPAESDVLPAKLPPPPPVRAKAEIPAPPPPRDPPPPPPSASASVSAAASAVVASPAIPSDSTGPRKPGGSPRVIRPPSDVPAAGMPKLSSFLDAGKVATRKVYAFGNNDLGQLGIGRTNAGGETAASELPIISGPRAPHQVALGKGFGIAATPVGLFTWGDGTSGVLGLPGGMKSALRPVLNPTLRGKHVTALACGNSHTLVLLNTGTVLSIGSSSKGALGLGESVTMVQTPTVVMETSTVRTLRAGADRSAAITRSGELFVWGDPSDGLLALEETSPIWKPRGVAHSLFADGVVDMAIGESFTFFLALDRTKAASFLRSHCTTSGKAAAERAAVSVESSEDFPLSWIQPEPGRLTPVPCIPLVTGGIITEDTVEEYFGLRHFPTFEGRAVARAIAVGPTMGMLLATGSVYTFGAGILGNCTSNEAEVCEAHPRTNVRMEGIAVQHAMVPVRVPDIDLEDPAQLACGSGFCMVLTKRGKVYGWGRNLFGNLGTGSCNDSEVPVPAVIGKGATWVTSIACNQGSCLCIGHSAAVPRISKAKALAYNALRRWEARMFPPPVSAEPGLPPPPSTHEPWNMSLDACKSLKGMTAVEVDSELRGLLNSVLSDTGTLE
jgi:alpha-tubulin suppressor-like RCC1 family protein